MAVRPLSQRKLSQSRYDTDTNTAIRYVGIYSNSTLYGGGNVAATYANMNEDNASGANGATAVQGPGYIRVDLGSMRTVGRVIVGYDYLDNLAGGWGTTFGKGLSVQVSSNATTWTTVTTTPTYSSTGVSNGLVPVIFPAQVQARYIQLWKNDIFGITEFQVWRK